MIASGKRRLTCTVREDIAERLETYAENMGISVNALMCMLLGQGVMAFDTSLQLLGARVVDESAEMTDKEVQSLLDSFGKGE